MQDVSFRVAPGDQIGLVGRNGAGKTTLTKILAGEALPAAGSVHPLRHGRLPAAGPAHRRPRGPGPRPDPVRPRPRRRRPTTPRRPRPRWAATTPAVRDKAMRRYERADAELHAGGGYAAESEAAQIASSLGIEERVLGQPLRTLSGGQRRRVELARILFSGAETLLLDEPTNHLDADSIVWLRDFLKAHKGGLVVISHDVGLLETTRQQGVPPRRQPGRDRRLQPGLDGVPRPARDRRAAPQARAAERREQGRRADGPGRQDARQGHQGPGRAVDDEARRAAAGRASRPSGARTGSPGSSSPSRRRAARPR